MSRKGFLVKVELDVQKITCPGVWLCSNGKVSLQIHMLDSCVQTMCCKPCFPICCYEKFVFYKTFCNDRRLNELQRSLNNEWFYAELIQWQNCEEGCVLATFQTTLDDLLYPSSIRGSVAGMDIDLLMEPTKVFPGTIAPKLEVSTKSTIEETLCDVKKEDTSRVVINPKLLTSTCSPPRKNKTRKVCHSVAFSRAQRHMPAKQKKHRPPFQYRKADNDLLLRKHHNQIIRTDQIFRKTFVPQENTVEQPCHCYCKSRSMESVPSSTNYAAFRVHGNTQRKPPDITCCNHERGHKDTNYCPVCSKYDGLFACNCPKPVNTKCAPELSRPLRLCSFCRLHQRCEMPSPCSPCSSDMSQRREKKVCFCVPSEKPSSLAQRLHEKLTTTIESNARLLKTCVECNDIT